jgi:hypothetical protein
MQATRNQLNQAQSHPEQANTILLPALPTDTAALFEHLVLPPGSTLTGKAVFQGSSP